MAGDIYGKKTPPRTGLRGFPDLVARVRDAIREHFDSLGTPVKDFKDFNDLRVLLEDILRKIGPLPDHFRRDADKVRQHLDHLQALIEGRVQPDRQSLVDPVVVYLLWRNYDYAKQIGGPKAARADLRRIVGNLTRGSKGRPPKLPLTQVQEMKRLRDRRWSYGRIANRLRLSRQQVRTALVHHFPEKKSR